MNLKKYFLPVGITIFYFFFHLINLTGLPIFADESIYIRWAQLIIDEPSRYLFFALNDGKTPLFIWSQLPFLLLLPDPLWATRFLAVLVGFVQIFTLGFIAQELGGNKRTQSLSMFLGAILPFWFFHHRMALMDGMLVLFLSLCWWALLKARTRLQKLDLSDKISVSLFLTVLKTPVIFWLTLAGVFFGLALWTKLPALVYAPSLLLLAFLPKSGVEFRLSKYSRHIFFQLVFFGGSLALGVALFGLLKLNPAFGQLFSRGGDFLYPITDIVGGRWLETLPNSINYLNYLLKYLTWPIVILTIGGLFSGTKKPLYHYLLWSSLLFFIPIAVLGKVVYPRYFLPMILPLTLSAAFALSELVHVAVELPRKMEFKLIGSFLVMTIAGAIVNQSTLFMIPSLTQPNAIPFVSADRTQYLTEWSSGHGIVQSVALIKEMAQTDSVAVATEGYFGTLPDAINNYLHTADVSNIYVEGIGQPVRSIPTSFKDRAQEFDRVWLLVNSHRMEIKLDQNLLIKRYCRPYNGPCLQVWDITSLVKLAPTPTHLITP